VAAAAGVQGVVGLSRLQSLFRFHNGGGTRTASLVRTRGRRGMIVVQHLVAVVPPSSIVRFVHLSWNQQDTEQVVSFLSSQLM